jgi:Dolichyl-phosphate-mannose-protein mannosyltransferase
VSGIGDYILGVLGLVAVVLSMAIAGRTTRRAVLPSWTGPPALLADSVLAIGILIVVAELLGLFGVLDGVLLVAACLIVGGGALRLEPMLMRAGARVAHWGKSEEPDLLPAPSIGPVEVAVAGILALIVAAQWAGPTLLALDRGIYGGDSLWYHMPLAAHIADTHSITGLLYTDPLYLNWFYPQVSELLHAGGILLLGNDFLSPLINMAWLGLALFAGYCIGRPYGTGPTAMAAVASVMAANLLFSRQPGNANNDVVAIALFLSAVALLLNSRWPGRSRDGGPPSGTLIVAGVAAGLALGTKLTVVPPVLALTVGVIWISGAGHRLRASAEWLGAMLIGGGYWYVRNLIVSGNPFPWQSIGPIHHAEALQGRHPYSIVHYATDTSVWASSGPPTSGWP